MLRLALFAVALTIGGLCLCYDVATFAEYYGSGPPYYGRTTNMDKWRDPRPRLAVVNAGAVVAIVLAVILARKTAGK